MTKKERKIFIGIFFMSKNIVILTISIVIAISVCVSVYISVDSQPAKQNQEDTVGVERDGATLPDF